MTAVDAIVFRLRELNSAQRLPIMLRMEREFPQVCVAVVNKLQELKTQADHSQ